MGGRTCGPKWSTVDFLLPSFLGVLRLVPSFLLLEVLPGIEKDFSLLTGLLAIGVKGFKFRNLPVAASDFYL